MPYEFGAVVLVPFPFTDQSASKQRPAVVVSNRPYNTSRTDVVVMAVTSQLHAVAGFGEVRIGQWRAAGLLKPSVVKAVFATLEQRMVIRLLGTLHPSDQIWLRKVISEALGWACVVWGVSAHEIGGLHLGVTDECP